MRVQTVITSNSVAMRMARSLFRRDGGYGRHIDRRHGGMMSVRATPSKLISEESRFACKRRPAE
jgi:hypothetical protein